VIGELLPETDTWAGVEWEEDEWVGGEILLQTVIDEAVGVEFVRCGGRISEVRELKMGDWGGMYRQDPTSLSVGAS